jgi:hypothetical protein
MGEQQARRRRRKSPGAANYFLSGSQRRPQYCSVSFHHGCDKKSTRPAESLLRGGRKMKKVFILGRVVVIIYHHLCLLVCEREEVSTERN